jgi:hypothetical protein
MHHPTYCKYNLVTKDYLAHYVHVATRPDSIMYEGYSESKYRFAVKKIE